MTKTRGNWWGCKPNLQNLGLLQQEVMSEAVLEVD